MSAAEIFYKLNAKHKYTRDQHFHMEYAGISHVVPVVER